MITTSRLRVIWTTEDYDVIKTMLAAGNTYGEIGVHYEVLPARIQRYCKRHGLTHLNQHNTWKFNQPKTQVVMPGVMADWRNAIDPDQTEPDIDYRKPPAGEQIGEVADVHLNLDAREPAPKRSAGEKVEQLVPLRPVALQRLDDEPRRSKFVRSPRVIPPIVLPEGHNEAVSLVDFYPSKMCGWIVNDVPTLYCGKRKLEGKRQPYCQQHHDIGTVATRVPQTVLPFRR